VVTVTATVWNGNEEREKLLGFGVQVESEGAPVQLTVMDPLTLEPAPTRMLYVAVCPAVTVALLLVPELTLTAKFCPLP
jgi:hypothetical protein